MTAKQRVIDERKQLQERILKLNDFVEWNAYFNDLPKEQQRLLKLQLRVMIMYREILDNRLDIWEDEKEK